MSKRLNTITALFLAGIVMSSSFTVQAKALTNPVTVVLDDKVIGTGYISKDGSTMVPLRVLSEALKYDISWNNKEQEATISNSKGYIKLSVGYHNAKVNDSWVQIKSVPEMKNNTVYVPLRVVADTMGAGVGYADKTAYISSTGKPINLPTPKKKVSMTQIPTLLMSNGYQRYSNTSQDYIRHMLDEEGFPSQISYCQVVPESKLVTISFHKNTKENLDFAKLFLQSVVPTKADEIYEIMSTQDIVPLKVFETDGYKVAIIAKENHSSFEVTLDATKNGDFIKNIKDNQ